MNRHQQLENGARPQTIVITVDNEPGTLARVAGLYTGRGWNIDSLTVYVDPAERDVAVMTLKLMATDALAKQVENQIRRIISVHEVKNLTGNPHRIELQLVLIRIVLRKRVDPHKVIDAANSLGCIMHGGQEPGVLAFSKASSEQSCAELAAMLRKFGKVTSNGSGTVAL